MNQQFVTFNNIRESTDDYRFKFVTRSIVNRVSKVKTLEGLAKTSGVFFVDLLQKTEEICEVEATSGETYPTTCFNPEEIPPLRSINASGFLTTNGQPACSQSDNGHYQVASLEGICHTRLVKKLQSLTFDKHGPTGIVVVSVPLASRSIIVFPPLTVKSMSERTSSLLNSDLARDVINIAALTLPNGFAIYDDMVKSGKYVKVVIFDQNVHSNNLFNEIAHALNPNFVKVPSRSPGRCSKRRR